MEILIVLAIGILNIGCFLIGVSIGQKVNKEEKVELPSIPNPIAKAKEHQEIKKAEKEMDRIRTILYNAEIYDGTSNGQRDLK